MSNEYNDEIRQMVAYSHMNRFGELDEVYRKAKAFDAILKSYDEAFSREHMADKVSNIIEEYESGEPYA